MCACACACACFSRKRNIIIKVSEYLFLIGIEKCFFLHKTMEKPYLNLHFKCHDFLSMKQLKQMQPKYRSGFTADF